jgi:hydroxylamine reductase
LYCFQCEEAAKNEACTVKGVCGKTEETADLQDLLIFVSKGIALCGEKLREQGTVDKDAARFVTKALFVTVTNVAWDDAVIIDWIKEGLQVRDALRESVGAADPDSLPECATWTPQSDEEIMSKASSDEIRITATEDEDVRSLRELLTIGCKGIAAYADHASVLGYEDDEIDSFLMEALASTTMDLEPDDLVAMVMKAGDVAVKTMALLDEAHRDTYGNPEITEVNIGVGDNPGILISGHDMKDMEELLKQTEGTGVDVYTHGEMLPANYYPAFKKYDHFVGNYGGSWWRQNEEFESFNGPIIMTTNCLTPIKERNTYLDRLFTTGVVSYPGTKHIADRPDSGAKDFSRVVELAKKSAPPEQIESGTIVGGFAHNQVMALADEVVDAVQSGAIKRFVVMGGCDGRHRSRNYYTEVAQSLPEDTVILTAGCAKYRYNKLELGDIEGIPRVLDAGQCNDSYSLAVIALKLKEAFGLDDINELPISYNIAWYEQKAVAVLLALLSLGVKGMRLGPRLPAFLSPNVAKVLVERFDIKPIGTVQDDVAAMMEGS